MASSSSSSSSSDDRGPQLLAVLILFLILAWFFVTARLYVRIYLSKSFGLDDWFLLMTLLVFSAYSASSMAGVAYGTGRHVQDLSVENISMALKFWWLCEPLYAVTTALLRTSIAFFLMRLCTKKIHFYIIYATMAVVMVYTTFYFFLVIFQCNPVGYFWLQYLGAKGHCIDPAWVPNASIAHSAVSATADWVLGLLPVVLIWDLQMNNRTKVSLGVILSMGAVAGAATVVRIPFIKVLSLTDDFLFNTTNVAIWSTIEPGIGLIAASAAALRPLFKNFYRLSTRNNSNVHTLSKPSGRRFSRAGYIRSMTDGKSAGGTTNEIELDTPPSTSSDSKGGAGPTTVVSIGSSDGRDGSRARHLDNDRNIISVNNTNSQRSNNNKNNKHGRNRSFGPNGEWNMSISRLAGNSASSSEEALNKNSGVGDGEPRRSDGTDGGGDGGWGMSGAIQVKKTVEIARHREEAAAVSASASSGRTSVTPLPNHDPSRRMRV